MSKPEHTLTPEDTAIWLAGRSGCWAYLFVHSIDSDCRDFDLMLGAQRSSDFAIIDPNQPFDRNRLGPDVVRVRGSECYRRWLTD